MAEGPGTGVLLLGVLWGSVAAHREAVVFGKRASGGSRLATYDEDRVIGVKGGEYLVSAVQSPASRSRILDTVSAKS